jgi:hypothetical protein
MMRGRIIPGGLQYFHVTDAGKQYLSDNTKSRTLAIK